MEKDRKPLIIPENCPPKDYVINGFTKTDISLIAFTSLAGGGAGMAVYAYNGNSIITVAMLFAGFAVGLNLFRRDSCTENLIDKMRIVMEYRKMPKRYEYRYVDIWREQKNAGNGRK